RSLGAHRRGHPQGARAHRGRVHRAPGARALRARQARRLGKRGGPSLEASPRPRHHSGERRQTMTTDTKTESTDEIIARRSADIDATRASNNEHRKVFVLPPGPKPTEKNGYDHRANMAATRQYAISQ